MKKNHTMNRVIKSALAAIAIAGFIFSNVSNSISQETPSQAVKAFYMAANEGRYSEANGYISSDVRELLDSFSTLMEVDTYEFKKYFWVVLTRNGTVKEIEILKEDVRGEYALVDWIIHFENGETEEMIEMMVKEDGQWKLDAKWTFE
jgi:hypothetical protein